MINTCVSVYFYYLKWMWKLSFSVHQYSCFSCLCSICFTVAMASGFFHYVFLIQWSKGLTNNLLTRGYCKPSLKGLMVVIAILCISIISEFSIARFGYIWCHLVPCPFHSKFWFHPGEGSWLNRLCLPFRINRSDCGGGVSLFNFFAKVQSFTLLL